MIDYDVEEEKQQLYEDMRKARDLTQMKLMPGWEIVQETLSALRDQAIEALSMIQPGDNDRVVAGHATFYAISGTITNLYTAVENAIVRGEHEAPVRLKEIDQILSRPHQAELPIF